MFNKYYTNSKRWVVFPIFSIILILSACREKPVELPYSSTKSVVADSAMVVCAHPLAAKAGTEILQKGGNAVDAAIAVQFALAVVYPRAGNIGGGGFMVIRMDDGTADALDYREMAPSSAHRDMYLDSLGNPVAEMSREGHLAVGVPGTVAGMEAAFEKHSQLKDWKALVEPAIRLAEEGFMLTETEASRLNDYREAFEKHNENIAPFGNEKGWKMGDLLKQTDLAATLKLIRDNGSKGFYEGKTADFIVDEMKRGGGIISHEDLKNYVAKWRQPILSEYKNYRAITMPPSSSGGVALSQLLGILENYDLAEMGFQSAEAVHHIVEAERRVYADRAEYLGDSDFYPVPIDSLLDSTYLAYRMSDFDPQKATVSDSIEGGSFQGVESFETTHTSIVDGNGNAVSVTTTLNLNYGSKVIVEGGGFFLNDEMDDFSAKPGVPNFFGLIGNEANAIQPGKRMLSSMTPTIVEKDGELYLVLGAPGGSTIITAVLQTFLNIAEFGMPADEAVAAPRFHHQWLPDKIMVEPTAIDTTQREILWGIGHELRGVNRMAVMKAIQVMPDGKLHGAGDPRNPDDDAEGY